MGKELQSAIASVVLTLATSCAQPQTRPIEIKGPLVDTPQHRYERPIKRPVNAPANSVPAPQEKPDEPAVKGSNEDLNSRFDALDSNLKTLDNRLRPRRDQEDK